MLHQKCSPRKCNAVGTGVMVGDVISLGTTRGAAATKNRILDVAAELCRQGMSILLVEQIVEKALRHAHHCYLVDTGRIVGEGPAMEMLGSDALHEAYLGKARHTSP